jgi:hypothetical protein
MPREAASVGPRRFDLREEPAIGVVKVDQVYLDLVVVTIEVKVGISCPR